MLILGWLLFCGQCRRVEDNNEISNLGVEELNDFFEEITLLLRFKQYIQAINDHSPWVTFFVSHPCVLDPFAKGCDLLSPCRGCSVSGALQYHERMCIISRFRIDAQTTIRSNLLC